MPFTIDTYALTTLSDVKEHLNIPNAKTSEDNVLTRMINAASMKIEQFIDRNVLKRSYTEFQDGRGNDRLVLRDWPADKPTELWDDPGSQFTEAGNLMDEAEYQLEGGVGDAIGVVLVNGRRFRKGNRNIKIVYQAGYTTVPYDIAESAIMVVEYMYDMRSDRRIGVSAKGKNQENTTFLIDLPEFVLNTLIPYQRFMEFGLTAQAIRSS